MRYTKFEKFWLLYMSKDFEVTLVKQIYSRYFQFVCKNIINWIIFEQDSTVQTRYAQKYMFHKHVFFYNIEKYEFEITVESSYQVNH